MAILDRAHVLRGFGIRAGPGRLHQAARCSRRVSSWARPREPGGRHRRLEGWRDRRRHRAARRRRGCSGRRRPCGMRSPPLTPAETAYVAPTMDRLPRRWERSAARCLGGGRISHSRRRSRRSARRRPTARDGSTHRRARGAVRHGLTARELEVLRLIAAGHSNREVGESSSSARPPWRATSPTSTASWVSTRGPSSPPSPQHDLV